MFGSLALVVVGLIVLVVASDRVVVSAVRISLSLGVSTVLIGALIVGLGTSIPELLVSSIAAAQGSLDVAAANVVGSNAANVTLVLGAAALMAPVAVGGAILRRETPLMLAAVAALAVVIFDDRVSRIEAGGLLVGLVIALGLLILWSRGNPPEVDEDEETVASRPAVEFVYGLIGIAATVAGAKVLLDGALDIGARLDWPATFLGLLLGVGTSLPELATAVAAARRKESDLILGNVIGSNIFNSLAVAGTAGLVGPGLLADFDGVAIWGMLAAVGIAAAAMVTGRKISRLEGLLLLGVFVGLALGTL
ncbi:MAG: sodium:calcium antiporter [Acidimicrobiia bacterium]|nr:sodium:calcium antiporter [Acidimicrobiia bacterium]